MVEPAAEGSQDRRRFLKISCGPTEKSGLLAEVSLDAAVNVQDLAVDEIGSLGGQEHGRTGQILGLAPATGGGMAHQEGVERMIGTVSLLLTQRSGLGSFDIAGANAVALDVVSTKLGADVVSIFRPPFAAA